MILLTVCSIPLALKSKKRVVTLVLLLVPLVVNTVLHFYLLQQDPDQKPTFGYLALVGAVSLLLIRKNPKNPNLNSESSEADQE